MYSNAEAHLHYRIANAPVLRFPFPHFYIQEVFPPEAYAELVATLPEQRYYKRLDETGTVPQGAYPERFVCDLGDAKRAEQESGGSGLWAELVGVFQSPAFAHRVLSAFNDAVVERFGQDCELDFEPECRLVRDFSNYAIPPHTDTPRKVVSLLFYLPKDEAIRDLGTSIYVPNDPEFRCDGRTHHPFKNFKRVTTAPFLPNSLLAFFKTDRAFHGVERIERPGIQRDSILYNIYVKHVGRRQASAPTATATAG
jgi:hypothetical protein